MANAITELSEKVRALRDEFARAVAGVRVAGDLQSLHDRFLGRRSGELNALLKSLGRLPDEARRAAGQHLNALKDEITRRLEEGRAALEARGLEERLARLNYHPVDPGKVTTRGEYSYDKKRGKLDVFLHSFAYPYRNFGGQVVVIALKDDTIVSMQDKGSREALYSLELEPELISGIFEGEWEQRRLVRLSQIPPTMINSILAAEDHRFYEHHGVDLVRTIKAGYIDLTSRHVRQGGSTLTQQLMKNFFLTRERCGTRADDGKDEHSVQHAGDSSSEARGSMASFFTCECFVSPRSPRPRSSPPVVFNPRRSSGSTPTAAARSSRPRSSVRHTISALKRRTSSSG